MALNLQALEVHRQKQKAWNLRAKLPRQSPGPPASCLYPSVTELQICSCHTQGPHYPHGIQTSKHPSFLFTSSWDWRLVMSIWAHLFPPGRALVLRMLWPAACFESLLTSLCSSHLSCQTTCQLYWNCCLSGTLVLKPEGCPAPFWEIGLSKALA